MARKQDDFDYKRYLASREWALLREQVRERCGDGCEHCFIGSYQETHHLTYERIGREELADLMAVCRDCHAFLSGRSNENPLQEWAVVSPPLSVAHVSWRRHLIIPYRVPDDWEWPALPAQATKCEGPGCVFCKYSDDLWVIFVQSLMLLRPVSLE